VNTVHIPDVLESCAVALEAGPSVLAAVSNLRRPIGPDER